MNILDYFYTEMGAAKELGVSRWTILNRIKEKKLDVQHIGKTGLIPKWQVELLRDSKSRRAG